MSQFPYIDSTLNQARTGLQNAISRAAAVEFSRIETQAQPSQGASNTARWYMIVEDSTVTPPFLADVKYAGREVVFGYDAEFARLAHTIVPNGRKAELIGTGENTPVFQRPGREACIHVVGDVIPVVEHYDDNGHFIRFADTEQASDIRMCIITARSGEINASYTIRDIRHDGQTYSGVVPKNRITQPADGIDWIAAEVGAVCLAMLRPNPAPPLLAAAIIFEAAVINNCPATP